MDNMGTGESEPSRKPMRRRSHTRKANQDRVINMAEARREIAHALHLHRSSSSTGASTKDPTMLGNSYNNYNASDPVVMASNSQYYCHSLMDTLPIPEPVWSTTAPSVLATPPPMEAPEFEWGESQAASYNWWLGFLKTLDGNINRVPKYPCVDNIVTESSGVFGQCQNVSRLGEPSLVESSDQSSSADEWLMFPTTEDQGER